MRRKHLFFVTVSIDFVYKKTFFMPFRPLLIIFNQLFKKILSGIPSEFQEYDLSVKQIGSRSGLTFCQA